jgi:hypothetical protein
MAIIRKMQHRLADLYSCDTSDPANVSYLVPLQNADDEAMAKAMADASGGGDVVVEP